MRLYSAGMVTTGRAAVFTLTLLACSTVPAWAQNPATTSGGPPSATHVTPNAEMETIEVIGRREALRREVQSFVSDLTQSDGEFVGRWNRPVCIWVSGPPAGQVAMLRSRIATVARSAGVPLDDGDACQANYFVFVTVAPDELLTRLRERHPRFLGDGSPSAQRSFLGSTQPVRAWYESRLLNADGTAPIENPNKADQFRLENSSIASGIAENTASVVIVVDARKSGAVSAGQLADYVSMLGFAQIAPELEIASRRTILSLFEDGTDPAPSQLTSWDLAFLKALYETDQANKEHRRLIVTSMTRDLERQAGK
jgi:hypothetical protein